MNILAKGTLVSGVIVLGSSAFAVPVFAQGGGKGNMRGMATVNNQTAAANASSAVTLTTDEQQTLTYMIEEEKLAHDIYVKMYEAWGINIFSNISKSETQHQSSLVAAAAYYGVTDPSKDGVGVFSNQDLQNLYNSLLAKGLSSRQSAFEVGKLIEQQDIADLQNAIDQSSSAYLDTVYKRLLKGSQNHLAAFNRWS